MTTPPRVAAPRQRGFTLVELVVVLALMGILAGIGAARFSDRRPFAVSAAADQLVSALRTAQATAVAQRRSMHVVLQASPASMQVCLDNLCTTTLAAPGSTDWLPQASGLTLDAPATLEFTADGAATLTSTLQVQLQDGPGVALVRVEAGSGHAYRP